ICLVGSWVTCGLLRRVREERGVSLASWVFLGALAGGATIWCTHFVAMIAYRPGVDIAYEPLLTGVSLAIAIVRVGLALGGATVRGGLMPGAGGAVFGLAVAAMHFVGMGAMAVDAVVHWSYAYVAVALIGAVAFGAAAFHFGARADDRFARPKAAAAMVL